MLTPIPVASSSDLMAWADAINQALKRFSDRDWNYSRISLEVKSLKDIQSPYVLQVDWVDVNTRQGQAVHKSYQDEVAWGKRHSHELGILEIISLRLNRALVEVTSSEYWHGMRPIIHIRQCDTLMQEGQEFAFWYRIEEAPERRI